MFVFTLASLVPSYIGVADLVRGGCSPWSCDWAFHICRYVLLQREEVKGENEVDLMWWRDPHWGRWSFFRIGRTIPWPPGQWRTEQCVRVGVLCNFVRLCDFRMASWSQQLHVGALSLSGMSRELHECERDWFSCWSSGFPVQLDDLTLVVLSQELQDSGKDIPSR